MTCYGDECAGCIHCEGLEYVSDIAFYIEDAILQDENGIDNMREIIYDILIKMLFNNKVN